MSTIESKALTIPVKERVRVMLQSLPDNCTFEDVQYGLYVIESIERGREAIDRGEVISHEEVKQRMAKWLTK